VASAFKGESLLRVATLNCHMRENMEVCFFLELIAGAVDFPTFVVCSPSGQRKQGEMINALPERARALLGQLQPSQLETFMSVLRCNSRWVEPTVPEGKEDSLLAATTLAHWVTFATGLHPTRPEELHDGADFVRTKALDPRSAPGRPGWLRDDMPGEPGISAWVPGQRWFDGLVGYLRLLRTGYRVERHAQAVLTAEFLSRSFPVRGLALKDLATRLQQKGPQENPDVIRQLLTDWAVTFELPDPGDLENGDLKYSYITCTVDTCAMWTLIHVVVAAVAARGATGSLLTIDGSALVNATKDEFPTVQECMSFVRTLVSAFLSCARCKENFLSAFDGCEFGRCAVGPRDYRGLALWLWRAHNAVSMRVARRHRVEEDRRWPMFEDCPMCWRTDLVLGRDAAERRLQQGENWRPEELDAPFHVRHVFWHIERTFVGLARIQLGEEDITPEEKRHIETATGVDHIHETRAARHRPRVHAGFVEPPPPPQHPIVIPEPEGHPNRTAALSVVGVALIVIGVVAVVRSQGDGVLGRSGREPTLRQSFQAPPQDEEELAADGGLGEPLDTDPSAE